MEALSVQGDFLPREDRERLLELIADSLNNGDVPTELFNDVRSENEMLVRYAKYIVVDNLQPQWALNTKLTIATTGFSDRGFSGSIRKNNNAITAADIESTALFLNVFDCIWAVDSNRQIERW